MPKIQVILLEDIASLGRAGDIVSVSEGYARNLLFPTGKAALATEQVQKEQQAKKRKVAAEKQEQLEEAQQLAETLEKSELVLSARVKDGDEIFGHINATLIVKELNKQGHLSFKAKDIVLPKPISKLGSYDVTVRLATDVEATIKVIVNPDEASLKAQEDEE